MYLWENMPFFLVIGSLIGLLLCGICSLEEGWVPLSGDNQHRFLLFCCLLVWRVAGGEIIYYYASGWSPVVSK